MINRSSSWGPLRCLGAGAPTLWGVAEEPGLAQPEAGTASGAQNSSLSAHSGGSYLEVRARLFTALQGCGVRDNTLKSREVQTAYKEKFPPTLRTEMQWKGAQRGCAVSSPGGFQDTTGSSRLRNLVPISQLVWLWAGGLTRGLSYSVILSHREKGLSDVLLRGISHHPCWCQLHFLPVQRGYIFSLKPRNPFIVIILEKKDKERETDLR